MSTEAIDEAMIHPTAIVGDGARIGAGTRIWHQSHIRAGAVIGEDCNIGFCVYVDQGAVVGDRCKIQNHVSVYEGVTLEDDVFVGPAATFTNDLHPRAHPNGWTVTPTVVRSGASIGARATIVCGVEIGAHAMVAAGAVVTTDVPPHALVMGVPARVTGWVCVCGWTLAPAGQPLPANCAHCGRSTEGVVS
jgi:acetyltransferase-like isoleucine patch superfamily enzyme